MIVTKPVFQFNGDRTETKNHGFMLFKIFVNSDQRYEELIIFE